jgi:ABC-2 type transport system permease protein
MAGFLTLQSALERPELQTAVAMAEPFALRAVKDATRYWTLAERNTLLPDFSGSLLYNRLLWIGIAAAFLALSYALYRFSDEGMSKRERKRQKLGEAPVTGPLHKLEGEGVNALPAPKHGRAALRALMWMRTKFEVKQVIKSPAFPVLMAWGLYGTIFVLLTQRYPDFRPEYPTTLSLIPEIEDTFRLIALIVAIYYAGELVWRERDRRVHELIDASPLPNWAYVAPKTIALAILFVAMLLVNVAASVGLQLSLGFTDIELGKYLLWYVLPSSLDYLLLASLAIFVQAISPHKTIGWGVMTLFVAWQEINRNNRIIDHNLLNFGERPDVPLSDLNGAGSFWVGAWTMRLYWGAFAVLLLVIAHLLWRRGTEIRLKPRLARVPGRLAGKAGWVAAAALVTFAATGAWSYYNVLNDYRTEKENEASAAQYEKRFGKYRGLPQPSLEELTLDIALHPKERRAVTRGRYLLRNLTAQPIPDLHVRLTGEPGLDFSSAAVEGARLILDDKARRYRIYHLERPMQPGEARQLTFETGRWHRGFRNRLQATGLVRNGSFLTEDELMPIVGMSNAGLIQDPEIRRKYGLPGDIKPPKLEDMEATRSHSFLNGWMKKSDITLSTDADQTPIAPGHKVSDVTRDGRRIARFVSTAPVRAGFSVQSARYAEKHRRHGGIDLAVYYHPRHEWNVDRMLAAMEASLDYYQANFGPYQYDHFRIVEFPAYKGFAQAFAGTIPFSESVGFIADYDEPDTLDFVTGITSHEFAHQWWPGQLPAAEMEGYTVFVETLAQYSAGMVMKKLRGEDQMRRYLRYELDRYLLGRSWYKKEPPLARAINQDHIIYRKGSMVMYLLQKRIGEDGVNRALRSLLARYKFKGAPYPRTLDLIAAFRAEAKTAEDQALITDLFERITLYDLKVAQPTAVRRADGKWDVTVPIEARKVYADEKGTETDTSFAERIEVGLFTAEPGRDAFDKSNVILMERQPIHSGRQVLKFVTGRQPTHAGVDPYNYYIDRNSGDNVGPVG